MLTYHDDKCPHRRGRMPVVIAGWITGAAISVGLWTLVIRALHP